MKGASEYKNYLVINNEGVYGIDIDGRFMSLEHLPSMSGFRGFGIHVPEYPDDINWANFDSVVKLCENGRIVFARYSAMGKVVEL